MTDTTNPPTTTTTQKRELTPLEAMRATLTRMESEFALALPPQIPVQKFVRTLVTAVQMNQDLLEADRRSLLGACMKAAQDGLLVDGREAALVIFRTKRGPIAQYMPMIGGLLKKLRNSGELGTIAAHVVYANDEFCYELGDDEHIEHRPKLGSERGEPIAAYAIARTKDGAVYREVMSVAQIEQVRSVSRAKDDGPWISWWDEMARKTVLRRLLKRLPSSADLDALLDHDNETNDLSVTPTPPEPSNAPLKRLKVQMGVPETEPAKGDAYEPEQPAAPAATAAPQTKPQPQATQGS